MQLDLIYPERIQNPAHFEHLTLIDFTKHDDTGKLGLRIIRNTRVEEEDPYKSAWLLVPEYANVLTHVTTRLGRHVLVRLCDEHLVFCGVH